MPFKLLTHADGSTQQVRLDAWRRQSKDPRDANYALRLHRSFVGANPPSTDLRSICSPVENQGSLGSCTANAFAGLIEANEKRAGAKVSLLAGLTATPPQVTISNVAVDSSGVVTYTTTITPVAAPVPAPSPAPAPKFVDVSRLFHYYVTRKLEGTVNQDSGATIRDTIKAGNTYGLVDETLWPYDVSKFKVNPPDAVWQAAAKAKITSYHAITDGDTETMKSALVSGYLVAFGFNVYTYFMSQQMASQGLLCRPKPTERIQGGHAVCLVGYDDTKTLPDGSTGAFLVRNSWGANWGIGGYFWMAYNYVSDIKLCSDFWVVVSSPL